MQRSNTLALNIKWNVLYMDDCIVLMLIYIDFLRIRNLFESIKQSKKKNVIVCELI